MFSSIGMCVSAMIWVAKGSEMEVNTDRTHILSRKLRNVIYPEGATQGVGRKCIYSESEKNI